jgi:hypothetical protein
MQRYKLLAIFLSNTGNTEDTKARDTEGFCFCLQKQQTFTCVFGKEAFASSSPLKQQIFD